MSDDATFSTSRAEVAIIGAGAVGSALAHRLAECGYVVSAVLSRRREAATRLADAVGAPIGSDDMADLPFGLRAVFLCVPDDAIAQAADALAELPRNWASMVVAHTSGAFTAEALAPLADAGAAPLSFHPLQTFSAASAPSAFDGIYIGLQGAPAAVTFGVQLAEDLGAHPVCVPAAAKTHYHVAAVLASNGLVALMGLVGEVLAAAGIDPVEGAALVGPLVRSTWENLEAAPPEVALTGPAVRGDRGTIAAHTEALATHLPHLLPAYAALTKEMVRLAVRGGRLDEDRAKLLLDVLHEDHSATAHPPN